MTTDPSSDVPPPPPNPPVTHGALQEPTLLEELRWLKSVTEDDTTNVYGRTIATIERLSAELERVKRDLEPFVPKHESWMTESDWPDETPLSLHRAGRTFGDLRRAWAALSNAVAESDVPKGSAVGSQIG